MTFDKSGWEPLVSACTKLVRRKLLRDSGLYLAGSSIPRALGIFLLPVWTAWLTPAEFGIVSTTMAVAAFAGALFGFGMTGVMNRFYIDFEGNPDGFRRFFTSNFVVFLGIAAVVSVSVLGFGEGLWELATDGQIPFYPFAITAMALYLGNSFWKTVGAVLRVERRAGEAVALEAGTQVLAIGAGLVFVIIFELGAAGRMWGEVIAMAVAVVVAAVYVVRRYGGLRFSGKDVALGFGFGLPLVPHLAAHWTLSLSNRVLITKFASVEEAGLYGIAGFVGLTLAMVQQSVGGAWSPNYLRLMRDNRDEADRKSKAYFGVWIASMGGVAVGAALFGREMVDLMADERYFGSWVMVAPVAVAYFFYGLYLPAINQLVFFKRRRAIPLLTISAAIVQIVGAVVLIPRWGGMGGAISLLAAYGYLAAVSHLVAAKDHRVRYDLRRVYAGLILVVVCCAGSYIELGVMWREVAIKVFIGIAYAASAAVLLVLPYRNELRVGPGH